MAESAQQALAKLPSLSHFSLLLPLAQIGIFFA